MNFDRVSLFLPCLADVFHPEIGVASLTVLRRAGVEADYPENQTCCGQWAVNTGNSKSAVGMAKHFLSVFRSADAVVCPSGSCVLTVRDHYPELLASEPAWKRRADEMAGRVFEITDFLVNRLGVTDLEAECPGRATLHDSCHPLRGLGIKDEPRRLLAAVAGLELVEMAEPETCCGFGGAFMAKHPQISTALAQAKVDQAQETGADFLVMTEPGCLINVDSVIKARGSRIKALHLVQVLARGNGGQP